MQYLVGREFSRPDLPRQKTRWIAHDSCLATGWEKLRSPLPAFPGGGPGGGPARLRVGAVGLQAVFLILVLARGESGGLELPAALLMATYLSMTTFIRA